MSHGRTGENDEHVERDDTCLLENQKRLFTREVSITWSVSSDWDSVRKLVYVSSQYFG